jgi:hypothetical protein
VRELRRIADAMDAQRPADLIRYPTTTITGSSLAEWIGENQETHSIGGDDARP